MNDTLATDNTGRFATIQATSTGSHAVKTNSRRKKAMLVIPPTGLLLREDRCQSPIQKHAISFIRPPMTLAYAAALWEQAGIDCYIMDYPAEKQTYKDFRKDVKKIQPDFLFINIAAPTLYKDLKACAIVKKLSKHWDHDVITILKGGYLFRDDVKILETFPQVDVVVRKDIDVYLKDFVNNWPHNMEKVEGLTYRRDGQIFRNPDPNYSSSLDELPSPARHLLNQDLYLYPEDNKRLAVIYTARGCPARCKFCLTPRTYGRKIRDRTPENVVAEMKECVEKHGIRNFFFQADTFTWKKEWTISVCKEILKQKLDVKWGCNSRVDTFDADRAKWMKKAGCQVIAFGVESGNQVVLNRMLKGIKLERCYDAVNICRKYGIASYCFFILGFPWDTVDTIKQTIDFAIDLDPDFAEFLTFRLMPGTAFHEMAEKDNIEIISKSDFQEPEIKLKMSKERLDQLQKEAIWRFHMRPKYIARTLVRARKPLAVYNYVRYGFNKLKETLIT